MAIFMFIFSIIFCVSVSLVSRAPNYEHIKGLAFGTLSEEQKAANKDSYDTIDVVLSVILVLIVIGVLSYFT